MPNFPSAAKYCWPCQDRLGELRVNADSRILASPTPADQTHADQTAEQEHQSGPLGNVTGDELEFHRERVIEMIEDWIRNDNARGAPGAKA